jgi:hypothetical protein
MCEPGSLEPLVFAHLSEQALGEIHPLLYLAQLASQLPNFVTKCRKVGFG